MIDLEGVGKSYDGGHTWAVRSLTLSIGEGELVALLGGSGCGKSTTVRMINRMVEPSEGDVRVGGVSVRQRDPIELRRGIGYVFQGVGLFPHMTVAQNVGVTPRLLGWPRADIERRVSELLELVGLPADEFGGRLPRHLSGGQRQRVGVARALAARPSVLIMDEPFGALDPITRDGLQKELIELRSRLGLTVALVTHDMTEALLLADRIGVMRDGRLLQVGAPADLLRRPADEHVADLVRTPMRHAEVIDGLLERGAR